jgi:hypothetical protein
MPGLADGDGSAAAPQVQPAGPPGRLIRTLLRAATPRQRQRPSLLRNGPQENPHPAVRSLFRPVHRT